MGVIDTLSAGYHTINRRLWLLAIPISLDLLFWLGPHVGLGRLTATVPWPTPSPDGSGTLQTMPAPFNLAVLLTPYIPTLLGWSSAAGRLGAASSAAASPAPLAMVFPAALGLLAVGLLLACLFLGGIAQLVQDGPADVRVLPRYAIRVWRKALYLHLFLFGLAMSLGVPALILMFVAGLINPALGTFVLVLLQITVVWSLFLLYFAFPAVVVAGYGPMGAVLSSVQVIRTNFWSSVALIILVTVINMGTSVVWWSLVRHLQPVGLLVGVVGNAYIMTGLSAAILLFYHDRSRQLAERRRAGASTGSQQPS